MPSYFYNISAADPTAPKKYKGTYDMPSLKIARYNAQQRSRFDDCAWNIYRRRGKNGTWVHIETMDFHAALRAALT